MPSFSTKVPHSLPKNDVVERLKGLLQKVRDKYGDQVKDLEEQWDEEAGTLSFKFRTYGFNIKGDVAVDEENVALKGDLPFAAVMFKGRIEQTISEEIKRCLEKE